MAQIINRQSTGELIGRGLGSGVSDALNYLVNKKMNDIQQRHTTKALEGFGIDPAKAAAIATMDPAMAQMVLKHELSAPSEQAFANALSGGYGQPQEQNVQQNGQNPMQQQYQMQQSRPSQPHISPQAMQALQMLSGQKTPELFEGNPALNQFIAKPQEEAWSNALKNYAIEQQQLQRINAQQQQAPQQQINPQQQMMQEAQQEELAPLKRSERMRAALAGGRINPNQARMLTDMIKHEETMELKKEMAKQRISSEKQRDIDRETKEEYDKVISLENASKYSDKRISRMEHLVKKGSLPIAALHNTFKELSEHGVGGEVPVIGGAFKAVSRLVGGLGRALQKNVTSRDTEEFEKLTADFVKDAKQFFGGRITNDEVKLFLETVPSLSQTDHGKRAIIRNMKIMNEAAHIKYQALKDILAENGGKRPANLAFLIEERTKQPLDDLAEQFKSGE